MSLELVPILKTSNVALINKVPFPINIEGGKHDNLMQNLFSLDLFLLVLIQLMSLGNYVLLFKYITK